MSTNITGNSIQSQIEILIKTVISNWELQNIRLNKLLDKLTDEQLEAQTAPGRNSGLYLLGHLTAVNDSIFTLLELGERLYPQLDEVFIKNPDSSGLKKPTLAKIKEYWNTMSALLKQKIDVMPSEEWFIKHSAVSAEDFEKEPHRNKLNILVNRTNHQSYHLGQMVYLDVKVSI